MKILDNNKICFLVGAADFGFLKDAGLPEKPGPGDCVISADAGRSTLLKLGDAWKPDYLIGDFDSLEETDPGALQQLKEEYGDDVSVLDADGLMLSDFEKIVSADSAQSKVFGFNNMPSETQEAGCDRNNKFGHLLLLPPEKNLTDLEAAHQLGKKLGYHQFVMTGCFGGRRFDHSLGNLHLLLSVAKEGGKVVATSGEMLVMPLLAGQSFSSKQGTNRYLSLIPAEGDAKGVTIRGLKYELEQGVLPAGSTLGLSNEIFKDRDFTISVESGSLWIVIEEK